MTGWIAQLGSTVAATQNASNPFKLVDSMQPTKPGNPAFDWQVQARES